MVNAWEGRVSERREQGGEWLAGRPTEVPQGTSDGPGDSPPALSSPTQAGCGLSTRTLATWAQGSAEVKGTWELAGQPGKSVLCCSGLRVVRGLGRSSIKRQRGAIRWRGAGLLDSDGRSDYAYSLILLTYLHNIKA